MIHATMFNFNIATIMATINQLTKQLESAKTRLAKYVANCNMYEQRAIKNLSKAIKATGLDLTLDNYESILGNNDFELKYSISSAIESSSDNSMKARIEQANIDKLSSKIKEFRDIEENEQIAINPFIHALNKSMSDFRLAWFDKMINWHSNNYDSLRNKYPAAIKRQERLIAIRNYFQTKHRWNQYRKLKSNLNEMIKSVAEITMHEANRTSKSVYMDNIQRRLQSKWTYCVEKLAMKCNSFCLNASAIEISNPSVTEKGFKVILQDGTNKLVDARIIWAAEYSTMVEPHTRYIVTERIK